MTDSVHQKRHYYKFPDTTPKKKNYQRYKKKLLGVMNDVNVAAYYPLIMEYFLRSSKLDRVDIETVIYIARLNRVFDKKDFYDAPNGFLRRATNSQILRLEQREFIIRWEGHNSYYNRKIQYKLTPKGRLLVTNFDKMMMRMKKIPLDPRYSDIEFVTPREKLSNNKNKIDWHASIVDFNKAVDREKNQQDEE